MLRQRKQRQRAVLAGIVALATLLGTYMVGRGFLETNLQAAVYDTVITAAPAKVKNQITIVALDDATVDRYRRWPLPRKAYADMLTALKPFTPKVVAFDVAFYDPSPEPAGDAAFAAAIGDAGNVYLAMQGTGIGEFGDHTERFDSVKVPIAILRDAAAGLGAANVNPDPDSRVREAQLRIEGPDGTQYWALSFVVSARHLSADVAQARIEGDRLLLPAKPVDRDLPISDAGAMRIYYAAPPHQEVTAGQPACTEAGIFCVVSMVDVIDGKVPKELLQFRSIYVGAHGLSAEPDNYPVPNSAQAKMWGVEIWANTAQSIFTNRYPLPNEGFGPTLAQTAILTLLGVLLVARLRLLGFIAALLMLAAYSFARVVLFVLSVDAPIGDGPVAVPSIGYYLPAIFWWVITLGYLLVEEQLAVARTQSTFGRFVTASVARTIMDREEEGALQLGGELREVTVLFGDIRGFTTMSEGMDPQTLMGTLNRYFEGMVAVVNRYQGTVNKYNGDNIMVIWNAPVEVDDHGRKAVECALEMQQWVVAERSKGGPDVAFGFGINSGMVVAGFMGASGRMEYTVIGDTANVASRLTSNDIARRDQVACSAETLARLGTDVVSVDLGAVLVKGRNEPVRCFQIDRLGPVSNPNPAPPPEVPIGKAAVAGFH